MIAERVRAGLSGPEVKESASGAPQLLPHSKSESVRPWRLLGDRVCASLPNGSESIPARCSGSAALSSRQASSPSSPSRCKAAAVLKSAFVIPPRTRTTGIAPLAEFAHSCLASISREACTHKITIGDAT
jgi:hypothetical protein